MLARHVSIAAAYVVVTCVACSGDDPSMPNDSEDVAGFRIVQGSTIRFEWVEGDNPAADTLELTAFQNLTVRFDWLDSDSEIVEVSDDAQLEVFISNSGAAEWLPDASDPFRGTFDTGPFNAIESGMRIRLLEGADTLFASPLLQLHVVP